MIMKKLAFFIALLIGLNASSVVRRAEEEEGFAIVQHDDHPFSTRRYGSIIQLLTNYFNFCFFTITKEGIFHKISWERIAGFISVKQQNNKVQKIVYNFQHKKDIEITDIQIID
jgi:hypothetical protein